MSSFLSFIRVHFRSLNLVLLAAAQACFGYFLSPEPLKWGSTESYRLLWLMIGTVLLAAAGYLINDVMNVRADRINHPDKPIIRANRSVWVLYFAMNALAIAIGWFFNGPQMGWLFLWVFASLFLYSLRLQKWALVGNFLIALLAGMSLLCIEAFIHGIPKQIGPFFIFYAFYTTLIRELLKDAEDKEGDSAAGYRTLPILISDKIFKRIIQLMLFFFLVVILAFIQVLKVFFMGPMEWIFLAYYALCVFLPAGLLLFMLEKESDKRLYTRASNMMKYIILTGTLSMMLF